MTHHHHIVRHRLGHPGRWVPRNTASIRAWVAKKLQAAGDARTNAHSWHAVIQEFRRLIEETPEIYKGFHEMFTQVPHDYMTDPTGEPVLKNYMDMLNLFDSILTQAPEWHYDPNNPEANAFVGFPINAVLDWPMGTTAGYTMFVNPIVNAQIKRMFDVWAVYLSSPASRSVLTAEENGWFGPTASLVMPNFAETYICDPDQAYYGFKSWDDFFTRRFRPGVREIPPELMEKDDIVHSACESAVYRVAHHVKARDKFWLKGQNYSIYHMLNNDPYATAFVGGTVYQAYLSATKYHRWNAPVSGVVLKTVQVPGTYYAEAPCESFGGSHPDISAPNNSQSFITAIATRALIFIRANDPRIGLMCFIGVGMAEASTCEITVKEGEAIVKGQEIGMFHFGGSTHCLVFRRETNIQINPKFIPTVNNPSPEVKLKEVIAWVGGDMNSKRR